MYLKLFTFEHVYGVSPESPRKGKKSSEVPKALRAERASLIRPWRITIGACSDCNTLITTPGCITAARNETVTYVTVSLIQKFNTTFSLYLILISFLYSWTKIVHFSPYLIATKCPLFQMSDCHNLRSYFFRYFLGDL